ncbi:hypothetical protein MTsPCn5_17070 [Croceitalea sp. MTPC5]|uniref:ParB/Sulfiredoxin domain-containing protein n=1 Tax=Croceitalea marina TaxID=1775166 RepID=A0ABW5MVF1_9FLAO|nr:hypothetical protein MTsPCn5_17070 [Croceitalea sp. MTPC5]
MNYADEAYCANCGLERMGILDSTLKFKQWHFKQCLDEKDMPFYDFWQIIPSKHNKNQKVPTNRIVGTRHPDYHSKMWLEVLGCLKRFEARNWDSSTFAKKYNDGGISFSKYDDKYFITGGNHRATIAKFFELEYLEVPVTEYYLDKEFYGLYRVVSDLNMQPKLRYYSRSSDWILWVYGRPVYFENFNMTSNFLKYYLEIEVNYKTLLKNKLNSFLPKKEESYHIRNIEQLASLKDVIILHKLKLSNSCPENLR